MSGAPLEELRMLTRVARLYHVDGLRQADVAERLSLSQSGVSRALRRAAQLGIVRTVIVPPPGVHAELEDRLRALYALRDAVVVDTGDGDVTQALGAATAAYLSATLARGDRIGIASWSATLMAAAEAMHGRTAVRAASVSQLVGGLGSPGVQFRLTERLAELTGAEASLLSAPGLLESASVRRALVRDPAVAGVMAAWERLTLALLGIGGLAPSRLLERSGNAIDAHDAERLRRRGAVGEICLRLFDAEGRALRSDLDRRVLGIAPGTLRAVPRRVGVAGGPQKYPAVRGALRGGWINVLITDVASARRLAEETP
jgi:DNA-binding transcriptional regulator LsrR (DeoR family)